MAEADRIDSVVVVQRIPRQGTAVELGSCRRSTVGARWRDILLL
jgi:hypothetical protein